MAAVMPIPERVPVAQSADTPLCARQTRNVPPKADAPPPATGNPDGPRFAVRVLDNPVNTYEEVISVCCAALGVSAEAGFEIARTIDMLGSCVVCEAPQAEAQRIAGMIGSIGIEVRLEPAGSPAPLTH